MGTRMARDDRDALVIAVVFLVELAAVGLAGLPYVLAVLSMVVLFAVIAAVRGRRAPSRWSPMMSVPAGRMLFWPTGMALAAMSATGDPGIPVTVVLLLMSFAVMAAAGSSSDPVHGFIPWLVLGNTALLLVSRSVSPAGIPTSTAVLLCSSVTLLAALWYAVRTVSGRFSKPPLDLSELIGAGKDGDRD